MATNLDLDDNLVQEAVKAGGHRTKKAAVTAALEQYVRRQKQLRLKEVFYSIDYDTAPGDYKRARRKR
jgi:Arc/MetJ family transcription regulator